MVDLQIAVREHRRPRPQRRLGNPTIARDHSGGQHTVRDQPPAFTIELGGDVLAAPTRPRRQRRVMQHPHGRTRRGPRRRRGGRGLPEATERSAPHDGQREHRRRAPQDLGSRDRRSGHRLHLDIGTPLISVDLQEDIAHPHGRPFPMGDNDLDLDHTGHHRADHRQHPPTTAPTHASSTTAP